MNLGDATYFDACVYTTRDGREQLRVAALIVAQAILGHSPDLTRRRDALMYQQELEKMPGALDLCVVVRKVWSLGVIARPGIEGILVPMAQLEAVAKNVYEGNVGSDFPWLGLLLATAAVGGGYYVYRTVKRAPRTAGVSGVAAYQWFAVTPSDKIAAGYEYKADARDFIKDNAAGAGLKVVSLRTLKQRGINPRNNWTWTKGASLEASR